MKPCLLFLSCKDIEEAEKILHRLLEKKLIACAKKISIGSSYLWKSKIESTQEVLLIMDSIEENFEKIDKEVKKLHSYKTYTLLLTQVEKINQKASNWLKNSVGERT